MPQLLEICFSHESGQLLQLFLFQQSDGSSFAVDGNGDSVVWVQYNEEGTKISTIYFR